MHRLRQAISQLATQDAQVASVVLPVIKRADKWDKLPNGWTQNSVQKFWESLTGDKKHKVTECIKQMDGKVDDPGAFCASLADKVLGPEWRTKKAMQTVHVLVKSLPPVVQRALREVEYKKRDIGIRPASTYTVMSGAGDGSRPYTVAVNLGTGQYRVEWGSWGGANMFNPRNQVDLDTTPRHLPTGGVVIQGTIGGHGGYASILANPESLQLMLPAPDEKSVLTDNELAALKMLVYKSEYRVESFERAGFGKYGPNNPLIQSLAQKGMVQITPTGILTTLKGKNMRQGAVQRVVARYQTRKLALGDLRPPLMDLFRPLEPLVRNYRELIKDILDWMAYFGSDDSEWAKKLEVTSTVEVSVQGDQIGGGWDDPPEYAEAYVEIPEQMQVEANYPYTSRQMSLDLLHTLQGDYRDRHDFAEALHALFEDDTFKVTLGKILRFFLTKFLQSEDNWAHWSEESLYDHVYHKDITYGFSVPTAGIRGVSGVRVVVRSMPNGFFLHKEAKLRLQTDLDIPFPEADYDGPDPDPWG